MNAIFTTATQKRAITITSKTMIMLERKKKKPAHTHNIEKKKCNKITRTEKKQRETYVF